MSGTGAALDWYEVLVGLAGGLALFLFALDLLAKDLKALAESRLRTFLTRWTSTPLGGLAGGTAVTIALDSSSATIVMLIALVDAGLLGAAAAFPVVLGANIGTTASSQLLAAGLDDHAPLIFAGGFLATIIFHGRGLAPVARIVMLIALVLFGLNLMSDAVSSLVERPEVRAWLVSIDHPLAALALGAVITAAVQSSSATIALVMALASTGVLPLEIALATMLGAEVGTCADSLLAAVGRSREALWIGCSHLLFNLSSAGAGLLFLDQLASAARALSHSPSGQVAQAQLVFNVVGALVGLVLVLVWQRKSGQRREQSGATDIGSCDSRAPSGW